MAYFRIAEFWNSEIRNAGNVDTSQNRQDERRYMIEIGLVGFALTSVTYCVVEQDSRII